MTAFLGVILAKRYTNPSADVISVLAGLDEVDNVFLDFANSVERVIRAGKSCKYRVSMNRGTIFTVCSRSPHKSYRCRSFFDIRSISDESCDLLYPSRSFPCFDEGNITIFS